MSQKKIYFENLDGFRAIAAIAVLFFHITSWIPSEGKFYDHFKTLISFSYQGGKYGIIFFFILSGFLISYLLFEEQERNEKINLKMFYIRRVLRIWPLYYLTLFIGFFIYPLFDPGKEITASLVYYGFFLTNFDHIFHGGPGLGILGVQWSVAVEEQFYLFWPLIFLIKDNKIKAILFSILIILSEFFYLKQTQWASSYYHFFSCIRYLGAGALIAYFSYTKKLNIISLFQKLSKYRTMLIYLVSILFLYITPQLNQQYKALTIISEILPFLFFTFVILEQNYSNNSFFKMYRFKILSWLGKISYGIYLTHMIAITIVNALFINHGVNYFLAKLLISFFLTILLSYISYHFFESYFLKIKDKMIINKVSKTKQ